MKIHQDHEYAYSTADVFALFTDPGEIAAKQEALGARDIRIEECDTDEDITSVRFVRELPVDVPDLLSKFLQPWNAVTQSEQWQQFSSGLYRADLAIDIANVPVTIEGTLKLEPRDGGCVNQVRLSIDCGIPFVGKALVDLIARDCERLIAYEYDYITERLASAAH